MSLISASRPQAMSVGGDDNQKRALEQLKLWVNANTISRQTLRGAAVRKVRHEVPSCAGCGSPRIFYCDDDVSYVTEPPCDVCRFKAFLRTVNWVPIAAPPDALADELDRLAKAYPVVAGALQSGPLAAHLQAAKAPASHRFALGDLYRMPQTPISEQGWQELMGRHAAGDFGAFGRLSAAKVTDADKFMPEAASQLSRNAMAVEGKSGFVVSRYPCPPAAAAVLDLHRDARADRCVDVCSVLSPGGDVTYAMISRTSSPCFAVGS
jgi:hypothetical protein